MAEEYEEDMTGEDAGMTGPGAPTPVSALEVSNQVLLHTYRYLRWRFRY